MWGYISEEFLLALVVARQRLDIICLFYWILVFALVQISSQARVLHKNSVYQRLLLLHLGSLSCMHRVCGWFKISALVAIVTEVVGGEHNTRRLVIMFAGPPISTAYHQQKDIS